MNHVPTIAQRSAERADLMLAHTGNAARRLLLTIRSLPANRQISALHRELAAFDPRLPEDVRRLADVLQRDGMRRDMAVERALALALADSVSRQAEEAGRLYQRGGGYPVGGLGSLGGSAGNILTGMAQGVACSGKLRDQATRRTEQRSGSAAADATRIGFDMLRGGAQCSDTAAPPPPPSDTSSSGSLMVPIVVGVGVLALAGGVVWAATRKKA